MAAINFPENPNDEDVFNGYVYDATYAVWNRQSLTLDNLSDVNATGATDGQTIIYDAASGTWIPGEGGSSFEISETAPEGAEAGDVWYNSATGKTYIYYTDVDGSQWVEIASTAVGYLDLDQLNDVDAPTPADGESLVYDSASGNWVNADATVEVYGVNTAATDYFMIPVGGDADRPETPANGHIRFNSDSGEPEYYSEAESDWFLFRRAAATISDFSVEYVVVAGGGGGGADRSGGGGAGGYRSNVSGESSGGGASAETSLTLTVGSNYTVTVGAGAPATATVTSSGQGLQGSIGEDSVFYTITSQGGGGGGGCAIGGIREGLPGGSGGGASMYSGGGTGGSPTLNQGYAGGNGNEQTGGIQAAGGGGGAGAPGGNGSGNVGGNGGNGVTSSITGSPVPRAGGGGGGTNGGTYGTGGSGGGANAQYFGGLPGALNTGGGGGGSGIAGGTGMTGGAGGSGIVILKYPSTIDMTADPGLVHTTNLVAFAGGDFNVTQFTSGTGTVVFN